MPVNKNRLNEPILDGFFLEPDFDLTDEENWEKDREEYKKVYGVYPPWTREELLKKYEKDFEDWD